MPRPGDRAHIASRRGRQRARKAAPLIAAAVVLLLLLTTLVIGWMVRQSMRELTRKSLESVLATNVSTLELWLSQRRADVDRVVTNDELVRGCRLLLDQVASGVELGRERFEVSRSRD